MAACPSLSWIGSWPLSAGSHVAGGVGGPLPHGRLPRCPRQTRGWEMLQLPETGPTSLPSTDSKEPPAPQATVTGGDLSLSLPGVAPSPRLSRPARRHLPKLAAQPWGCFSVPPSPGTQGQLSSELSPCFLAQGEGVPKLTWGQAGEEAQRQQQEAESLHGGRQVGPGCLAKEAPRRPS